MTGINSREARTEMQALSLRTTVALVRSRFVGKLREYYRLIVTF